MSEMNGQNQQLRQVLSRTYAAEAMICALEDVSGHDDALCRTVWSLCTPLLGVAEGENCETWLCRLCDRLSDRMFPDAEHPAPVLTDGEQLYLQVLESLFSWRTGAFDPMTDLLPLEEDAGKESRVAAPYERFCSAAAEAHFMALLRISREVRPFDPASHTIGVHNVAVHTAALAKKAGLHVDLPLVSAAALGHDIGKFGCRGDDARRIPYLHYYYTWQWFSDNGIEEIGHISANHSTWDLEFENLPVESLLLIYADFRVRGSRGADGREKMAIYTLAEAGEIVFSKLLDVTAEKQRRYHTVYEKLHDFELLLHSLGVPTDMGETELRAVQTRDESLLSSEEALQALRNMALSGSIRLMYTVSVDRSFELLLEQAKSEKNLHHVRTYLLLFNEYSTYMTKANKKKLLHFLYELLMHPDGDVRRMAGQMMGRILANSGPKYRKERPAAARDGGMIPTMMALLDESVELWDNYVEACLHPDLRISPKHALRISNSLKTIGESLFAHCDAKEAEALLEPLLRRLLTAKGADRFVLVDTLARLPYRYLPTQRLEEVVGALAAMLSDEEISLRLAVFRCLEKLHALPPVQTLVEQAVRDTALPEGENGKVLRYMQHRVLGLSTDILSEEDASGMYLSNLKSAVHWTVKLAQVYMLFDHAQAHPETAFHTAMHLSNVLCVSEHLPVRKAAGARLLELAPLLSVDHANEITVDLLRELETGQDQISYVVPPVLGQLMCQLPDKELREAELFLENQVHGSVVRSACMALQVVGEMLNTLTEDETEMTDRGLGLLMIGVCHYKETIHSTALQVLCRDVLGSSRISLRRRGAMLVRLHKKLLTMLTEARPGQLTFFNAAAMLNHLYRFIVEYQVQVGPLAFPAPKPAAFFPGTFDPFSVGHRQIVEEIRKRGYEVYLAVDEFSWSKMPLPKLLRRKIAAISTADQWDTYLFPDDVPVNIAMPEDLAKMAQLLPGREVWLVAGSDVIYHASAYRGEQPGGAAAYNHLVFCRNGQSAERKPLEEIIHGQLKILSLPPFFEAVSSSRIREFIDRKLDISMLVDPVVQSFIYEQGLYIRSPELKNVMTRQKVYFRRFHALDEAQPAPMARAMSAAERPLGVLLCGREDRAAQGWAVGHTLQAADLYDVLHSIEAAKYVRRYASGRILMIHEVISLAQRTTEACRVLLNELLARSLERDHTYALCRCAPEDEALRGALDQMGFVPVASCNDIFYVDMRAPVILLQDVLLGLKKPHQEDAEVKAAVMATRPKLRGALLQMFPGKLLLCFDSEMLNQAVMERVERINGVQDVPEGVRRLGPYMCVPYGKILSNEIVPNTVTKTLHAEKRFTPDMKRFEIMEYPGYSPLKNQVRTLKSFHRPVLLVDDLLHKGYRIDQLDRVFREENLQTERTIVAVMSGYGQDLMRVQGRKAECEYFIPNLHYWLTESLLYPFIGGDSVIGRSITERMLPSINLILPYYYPNFLRDVEDRAIRVFSRVAMENALEIMRVLERRHQEIFNTTLTIRRLREALLQPRLPDEGNCMHYNFHLPASAYLEENLTLMQRICRREENGDDL